MGRKNSKAREKPQPESTVAMVARLNKQNTVYKAHKREEAFSMSLSIGSRIPESISKSLRK
jgi:hypothetical protein